MAQGEATAVKAHSCVDVEDSRPVEMLVSRSSAGALGALEAPGLMPRLEQLLEMLELCRHSLEVFLEDKRQLFPRFYFMASLDLLELLSCGNDPAQTKQFLPKMFDNIAGLITASEVPSDTCDGGEHLSRGVVVASGMVSSEGEAVPFTSQSPESGQVECTGGAEEWLSSVQRAMVNTIHRGTGCSLVMCRTNGTDTNGYDVQGWVMQSLLMKHTT